MKTRWLAPLLALLTPLLAFGAAGPIYRNPFTESPPALIGITGVVTNGAAVNQVLAFDGAQVVWQNDQTGAAGATVWENGAPVSDANFLDSGTALFQSSGTNISVYPTNLTAAQLATDSVSADELNAAGVEAELEAVLDLADLQGVLTLDKGGTGVALGAPAADRILFYDFSGGAVTYLEVGTGLQITGTTLSTTGAGVGDVLFANFDDSTILTNGPAGSEIYVTNITSSLIVDGTISSADIGANQVNGTHIALGGDAQGDLMYYSGANWVALSPGIAGQMLVSGGAAANPAWATLYGLLYVNGTRTTNANLLNDTFSVWQVTDLTNVVVNATNLTAAHLATDSVSAEELNASGVTNELSAILDLAGLQGVLMLGHGGTGSALVDPGADRILFWDDTAGSNTWLQVGSGLQIVGDTLSATGAGAGDVLYTAFATTQFGTNGGVIYILDGAVVTNMNVRNNLTVTNALTAQSVTVSNVAASSLLRIDANKELAAVTVGSGLSFDGTTLTATGSGVGDVLFTDFNTNQFNTNNATWDIALKDGARLTNTIEITPWVAIATNVDFTASHHQYKQLTNDLALTFSNDDSGRWVNLWFENDATGGWALTWPANTVFLSPTNGPTTSTAPQVNTNALAHNRFRLDNKGGTNYVEGPFGNDSTNLTQFAALPYQASLLYIGWATNASGVPYITNIAGGSGLGDVSYTAFATTQFGTNGGIVYVLDGAVVTNLNVRNNLSVTNAITTWDLTVSNDFQVVGDLLVDALIVTNGIVAADAQITNTFAAWDGLFTNSLALPYSAAPTTDANGEVAVDSTITDHRPLIQYRADSTNYFVVAIPTADLVATDGFVIKYNAANDKFTMAADETAAGSGDALLVNDSAVNASGSLTNTSTLIYRLTAATPDLIEAFPTNIANAQIAAGAGIEVSKLEAIDLGTDTVGDYVAAVADGTGIDGTATGEGSTFTPVLDLTETTNITWSAGGSPAITNTFDVQTGTDPILIYGDGTVNIAAGALQEGGNDVYNSSETPGGELGGTWASPTVDDSLTVATWTMTGLPGLTLNNGATSGGGLRFLEDSDGGTEYTEFQVTNQAANIIYVLPPDDGDAGEQLTTDGDGKLTWEPAGAGGSGDSITVTNGAAVDPDFTNNATFFFVLDTSTSPDQIFGYPTNLTAAQLATDSVSADELNATGVEAELEAVLDLPELQGTLLSAQLPNPFLGSWAITNALTVYDLTVTNDFQVVGDLLVNALIVTNGITASDAQITNTLYGYTGMFTNFLQVGGSVHLSPTAGNLAVTNAVLAQTVTASNLTASLPVFTDANKALSSSGTFDASVGGLTLKFTDYIDFVFPSKVDGTGATILTNDYSNNLWGLATYSGTAETNGNFSFYRLGNVPIDLDSGVAMTIKNLAVRVSGTDVDDITLDFGYYFPASSGAYAPANWASFTGYIRASVTPSSPAADDVFFFSDITLTGWASALTAGRPLYLGVARLNTANDDSVTIVSGTIEYTRTK